MRLAIVAVVVMLAAVATATPLDDYVNKPDPNYAWTDTGLSYDGIGCKYYVLNMTSQAWLTANDWHFSNGAPGPLWWHFMLVIVPNKVRYTDTGFVYITGNGNNPRGPPDNSSEDAFVTSTLAVNTGTIGAALFQIPNESIMFNAEQPPTSRSEDAIIAYAWNHFLQHPDQPEWLPRLPMTKAAVRAMDTVAAFAQKKFGYQISKFVVAGASKRGWTTWTTAAVDKRVIAAIPLVMDELNFIKNIRHHYRAYGGWSFALDDYWKLNFTLQLDNPVTQQMMDIIDPIVYSSRLTMPKLIVDAGGDEFFLPDDQRYWWDDMSDEKHLLMVPNAEHSLATGILTVLPAVAAFTNGVLQKMPRPVFNWTIDDDNGVITVSSYPSSTQKAPRNVTMWHAFSAANTGRRDFRLVAGFPKPGLQPVFWSETPLKADSTGTKWVATCPRPPAGRWTAFFVDMKYEGPQTPEGDMHFRFTTPVSIYPNTFPFPDCQGQQCLGKLL